MYLIKQILANGNDLNGLRLRKKAENNLIKRPGFWGNTTITFEENLDDSKTYASAPYDCESVLLLYASKYSVSYLDDGFIHLKMDIKKRDNKKDGYIVFANSLNHHLDTNGEILFSASPNDIVVILRNGDFLELDGKRFDIINNKMYTLCEDAVS